MKNGFIINLIFFLKIRVELFVFYILFINFVNEDKHFKIAHVILSENKKNYILKIQNITNVTLEENRSI